jgi:RNA chaperone Hfq
MAADTPRKPTLRLARQPASAAPAAPPPPTGGLETPPPPRHSEPAQGDIPAEGRKNKDKGGRMADKQSLQDAFLNHVRKTKVPVTIFLINGVKLQGVITWFDSFCVLLRRDGQSQLVYKSAISTIMPAQPISLHDGED